MPYHICSNVVDTKVIVMHLSGDYCTVAQGSAYIFIIHAMTLAERSFREWDLHWYFLRAKEHTEQRKKKTIFHNNLGNSHIVFHKCTSSFLVRTREDEHCRHLRHSSAHTSNMHTTRTANGECYSLRCTSKYTTPIISHLTCNNCCGDVRMGPSKATTTTTNHYTAKFVHA